MVDGQGIPLGSRVLEASPAEVTLVEHTLNAVAPKQRRKIIRLIADKAYDSDRLCRHEHTLNAVAPRQRRKITRLIADRAYDSDRLRTHLAAQSIELICPHRKRRKKPPTQDGRPLRRYRHRWKIERTFAWLGNFRRLVVRYERNPDLYHAFFQLACAIITLRHL